MFPSGPYNLITDVDGIRVGNAQDVKARTGVTVVLPDQPTTAAVDVRGGAPGTHETDALDPTCLVEKADAIVLSGGFRVRTRVVIRRHGVAESARPWFYHR